MEDIMKKDFIKKHYNELIEIFNCIRVGIWITDNETNTILVTMNPAKQRTDQRRSHGKKT